MKSEQEKGLGKPRSCCQNLGGRPPPPQHNPLSLECSSLHIFQPHFPPFHPSAKRGSSTHPPPLHPNHPQTTPPCIQSHPISVEKGRGEEGIVQAVQPPLPACSARSQAAGSRRGVPTAPHISGRLQGPTLRCSPAPGTSLRAAGHKPGQFFSLFLFVPRSLNRALCVSPPQQPELTLAWGEITQICNFPPCFHGMAAMSRGVWGAGCCVPFPWGGLLLLFFGGSHFAKLPPPPTCAPFWLFPGCVPAPVPISSRHGSMGQRERGRLPGAASHRALPTHHTTALSCPGLPAWLRMHARMLRGVWGCLGGRWGALGAHRRMLSDFGGIVWGECLEVFREVIWGDFRGLEGDAGE